MTEISHFFRSSRKLAKIGGFTQLEMLVGTAIIAALAGLLFGISNAALGKCATMREIAAGKTLITAYSTYAADNNGKYLPGIDKTGVTVWFQPKKKNMTGMVASRYPFRLAPYFDYRMDGTILVNNNRKQIEKNNPKTSSLYDYSVSVSPAFGINYLFVGGSLKSENGATTVSYPSDCVVTQSMADRSILVFASAAYHSPNGENIEGFHYITPPNSPVDAELPASAWSPAAWDKNQHANQYGNVDARHDGKAVCVYLNGSIQIQTIEELRDMRLWSRNARIDNDPNYVIPN